jgi:hypothetical protein
MKARRQDAHGDVLFGQAVAEGAHRHAALVGVVGSEARPLLQLVRLRDADRVAVNNAPLDETRATAFVVWRGCLRTGKP